MGEIKNQALLLIDENKRTFEHICNISIPRCDKRLVSNRQGCTDVSG